MAADILSTNFPTALSGSCDLLLGDRNGFCVVAHCTGTPPTTANIFAHGAIISQGDTGTGANALYQNTGSSAVPAWSLIDTGTSFSLPTTATDSTTTTGTSFALVQNAVTTGNGLTQALNGLTTGTGHSISHTTSVIASGGSLLRLSSTGIDTGTTTGVLLDLSSTASLAGTQVLGTFSGLTTGIGLSIVANALTTGFAHSISHTTSVIASGGSLCNISSTSIDTATTSGILLNLSSTGSTTGTQVLLTASALTTGIGVSIVDSSSSASARQVVKASVTNSAAVLSQPFQSSNAALQGTGSKFTKHIVLTDGSKTSTIWLSTDATTPNGNLSGTVGDLCVNGPSGRSFYCTGTTNWTASNA